jgi:glycosyltransferase involved in cell wall biosynthesis
VRLILLPLADVDQAAMAKTKAEFALEAVMRVNAQPIRGLWNRLRHEFDPWFSNTHGRSLNRGDFSQLADLIAEHDMVWVHNLAVANSAGISLCAKSVLDVDDVLSQYYRSALMCAKSWVECALIWRRLWLWKRREAVLLKRFSILTVCSEADRKYLGASNRIHTIPNGYEFPAAKPQRCPVDPPRIGFIGTLKYPPTREGVEWFIGQVWPRIKKSHTTVRLRLVGAETDSQVRDLGPDIDGLGWIEDASAEIATWSLMIVPIRMGGGTRIKIVEGFSRKCPIVSTSVGAFGYEVTSGEEILLADKSEDFTHACLSILRDARLGEQLANRAWQKYIEHWNWDAIGPRVTAAVEHCLSLSNGQVSRSQVTIRA